MGAKIRSTARVLLTKDEKDPQRIFEGQALMRRMIRYGILDEDKQRLDYVLGLKIENFMERRLQTLVFKRGSQSRSIMLVFSSVNATSVLGARLSMCHPSW